MHSGQSQEPDRSGPRLDTPSRRAARAAVAGAALIVAVVTLVQVVPLARDAAVGGMFSGLGLTIALYLGMIGSFVAGIVALVAVKVSSPGGSGRVFAKVIGLLLAAGWTGYLAAAAYGSFGSPSVRTSGTLHVEVGVPLSFDADLTATCTSVVGDADLMSSVAIHGSSILSVSLRDAATGAASERVILIPDTNDGWASTRARTIFRTYTNEIAELIDHGRTGRLLVTYQRPVGWAIPGQWPLAVDVRIDWTCPNRRL